MNNLEMLHDTLANLTVLAGYGEMQGMFVTANYYSGHEPKIVIVFSLLLNCTTSNNLASCRIDCKSLCVFLVV